MNYLKTAMILALLSPLSSFADTGDSVTLNRHDSKIVAAAMEKADAVTPDESPCGFGRCYEQGVIEVSCQSSKIFASSLSCKVRAPADTKDAKAVFFKGAHAKLWQSFLNPVARQVAVQFSVSCVYPNGPNPSGEMSCDISRN